MPILSDKPNINPAGRYSAPQAARLLGVHRSTVWRWMRNGKLRPFFCKGNSRIRFCGRELLAAWGDDIPPTDV